MSNPAVIFGCSLLPSIKGRSSFHIGRKSPSNFADPKGTAYGGSAFSSHLQRKPLASSPIHKPHSQDGSGTNAADRCATEAGQHHSASLPEDLGGAECPSRTVLGSHGDVRIGGSDHHCRLESVSGDLSQGLLSALAPSGEYRPGGYLRGTVPADVNPDLLFGDTLCHSSGLITRTSAPREAEVPVGLVRAQQCGVEEHLSVLAELRDGQCPAPTYEHVTVRQHLHVAGRISVLLVGVGVLAYKRGLHLALVKP